jgi:hypothetical protein
MLYSGEKIHRYKELAARLSRKFPTAFDVSVQHDAVADPYWDPASPGWIAISTNDYFGKIQRAFAVLNADVEEACLGVAVSGSQRGGDSFELHLRGLHT